MKNHDEPPVLSDRWIQLVSELVPFAPSNSRRAGAARLMAERIGEPVAPVVEYPLAAQVLAPALGAFAGNALTGGDPRGAVAGGVVGHIGQALWRHYDEQKTLAAYDKQKRKRLTEVEDDIFLDPNPSTRLGALQAHDAMRRRKFRDLGVMSETADLAPVAASLLGMSPAVSLPVTGMIDYNEARRFKRAAEEKRKRRRVPLTDQRSAPALPALLATLALSVGANSASNRVMQAGMRGERKLADHEWEPLVRRVSGASPVFGKQPVQNAFAIPQAGDDAMQENAMLGVYAGSRPVFQSAMLTRDGEPLPEPARDRLARLLEGKLEHGMMGSWSAARRQIKRDGMIIADPEFATPSVLAHEAGHVRINSGRAGKLLQFLQDKVYPHSKKLAPAIAAGSFGAGMATGSPLLGALAGTGIGAVAGGGVMAPEIMAHVYGQRGLQGTPDARLKTPMGAAGTYAAFTVLPNTLAGMIGGWIAKRRRQREEGAIDEASAS